MQSRALLPTELLCFRKSFALQNQPDISLPVEDANDSHGAFVDQKVQAHCPKAVYRPRTQSFQLWIPQDAWRSDSGLPLKRFDSLPHCLYKMGGNLREMTAYQVAPELADYVIL